MTAKHVVVVGAGIVGASIAWHLAHYGARVTVIDSRPPGGTATPNTFAWINASWGNPEPYFRLRVRSIREWSRLAAEVPALPLAWCGGLCWDLPEDRLRAFVEEHASWGYDIRLVGRAEAVRLEPGLSVPPLLAAYVPAEGVAEPEGAVGALLADAERRGAVLRAPLRVLALSTNGGRITGVETTGGTVIADEVVLAAGTAVPDLAATAGVAVPLEAPPGLLVHAKPAPRMLNGLVMSDAAHLRQSAAGRIVAGADFLGANPGDDPAATAEALFAHAKSLLKGGAALELERFTVGYRPTPADGFPIVGRPVDLEGLYVAVMHSGMTLAPAVGRFASAELLRGIRDPLLAPYGLERFGRSRL